MRRSSLGRLTATLRYAHRNRIAAIRGRCPEEIRKGEAAASCRRGSVLQRRFAGTSVQLSVTGPARSGVHRDKSCHAVIIGERIVVEPAAKATSTAPRASLRVRTMARVMVKGGCRGGLAEALDGQPRLVLHRLVRLASRIRE
jgi:hypothetical protein